MIKNECICINMYVYVCICMCTYVCVHIRFKDIEEKTSTKKFQNAGDSRVLREAEEFLRQEEINTRAAPESAEIRDEGEPEEIGEEGMDIEEGNKGDEEMGIFNCGI